MGKKDKGTIPREYRPFKIRAAPDGKYFDDEEFTHGDEDILYVKVDNHPVETALKLLEENGYKISINAERNEEQF